MEEEKKQLIVFKVVFDEIEKDLKKRQRKFRPRMSKMFIDSYLSWFSRGIFGCFFDEIQNIGTNEIVDRFVLELIQ